MTRRELRERIFKLVFRMEFHSQEDMLDQIPLYFADEYNAADVEDTAYIQGKFEMVQAMKEKLDQLINENTEGWDTARMGKVELAILRLAVYEMLEDDDVPAAVAINEAVEIAKEYGQDNSGAFVNAVLSKIKKAAGIE